MNRAQPWCAAVILMAVVGLAACGPAGLSGIAGLTDVNALTAIPRNLARPLRVVASTSILADVARNVGGDLVELNALVPLGSDPHDVNLAPSDLRSIEGADVVFVSGLGLETHLLQAVGTAGLHVPIVSVSDAIEPFMTENALKDHDRGHMQLAANPHVWMDPSNVIVWAKALAFALARLDPTNELGYQERSASYIAELKDLDASISELLAPIPPANRLLVSDHASLEYFAERYDFVVLGEVIPSFSTQAEPSPRDLAQLETMIAEHRVRALFVGMGANRAATAALSQDLGIPVEALYVGSLSGSQGPASNYLDLMKYDATVILDALVPERAGEAGEH